MARVIAGITTDHWIIILTFAGIVLYTILWFWLIRGGLQSIMEKVLYMVIKPIKTIDDEFIERETRAKRISTISENIVSVLFFFSYIPLIGTLVAAFRFQNSTATTGAIWWGTYLLLASLPFIVQFFRSVLQGTHFILMDSATVGDDVHLSNEFIGESDGRIIHILPHDVKLRRSDNSIITVPSEIANKMLVENYSRLLFFFVDFDISYEESKTVMEKLEKDIRGIKEIATFTREDEAWYGAIHPYYSMEQIKVDLVAARLIHMGDGRSILRIPVRSRKDAEELRHILIRNGIIGA